MGEGVGVDVDGLVSMDSPVGVTGPVTAVNSDDAMTVLAGRARTVLASGRTALLTLPCERARGWVGMIDDGGEPLLMARADGRIAEAAQSGRRGWVDVPGHFGERLILTGTLRVVPGTTAQILSRLADLGRSVDPIDAVADGLAMLAVSVDEVVLCLPPADQAGRVRRWSTGAVGRRIDLATYAFAEPDLIDAYAPELIDHLNTRHAEQMCQLAGGGRTPGGDIAGAYVSGLDRYGMDLWRVDTTGAHPVRIVFDEPLGEPRSLGRELRRLLERAGRDAG
ncbi:DUF2470 domain-containing protein [Frankia umida]|nr:DUF2470 domain-containing protein [Frankia umida]